MTVRLVGGFPNPSDLADINHESRFFERLARCRLTKRLACLDLAAWHGPQALGRRPASTDQKQSALYNYDGTDCRNRVTEVRRHGFSARHRGA